MPSNKRFSTTHLSLCTLLRAVTSWLEQGWGLASDLLKCDAKAEFPGTAARGSSVTVLC